MGVPNQHFLVVGAGLSGCCVAVQLLRRGAKVTLLDSGENHSSAVAAGLINPLVFRRMTKSWRLDEFMPYLQSFYPSLEAELGQRFFHPVRIRRIFAHPQEREFWMKRQHTPEFEAYMEPLTPEDDAFPALHNICGTARVKQAAYVDVELFLQACKAYVSARGEVLTQPLNYTALRGNRYEGIQYAGVIFCEGFLGKDNPWFNFLPLGQTKGETLTIRTKDIPQDESLNLKCFVLPKGDGVFKVGATYGWHDPSTHCTEEGRKELIEKISWLTDQPYMILDQRAGVRPTSIDRRPFLGAHPKEAQYYIFNGLGTKGYMLAPLLSKEFVDFVLDGKALHSEVCIERFATAE
jgi:glycine/D-amino acid oxidase-like deaminating enzyme